MCILTSAFQKVDQMISLKQNNNKHIYHYCSPTWSRTSFQFFSSQTTEPWNIHKLFITGIMTLLLLLVSHHINIQTAPPHNTQASGLYSTRHLKKKFPIDSSSSKLSTYMLVWYPCSSQILVFDWYGCFPLCKKLDKCSSLYSP